MDRSDEQNIISLKKILYNLKKYCWILGLSVIVAVLVVVISIDSDEDSLYKNETIFKVSPQIIDGYGQIPLNAQGVADEFNVYLSTKDVEDKINNALSEKSYNLFSEQDIPTYEITNNIIKMQITGTQSERTELLAKVLGEEFAEYNNKFNQEIKITFINTSTNEILTQSSFLERIVSIKNVFIILLGIIAGGGIIFIIIFIDDKIYIQDDLKFQDDLKCLYVVRKKTKDEDILHVKNIVKYYQVRESNNLQIWTLENEDKYKPLLNGNKIIEFNSKELLDEKIDYKVKIIFYFSVGKTKKEEIKKILAFQRGIEKECLGYILVE